METVPSPVLAVSLTRVLHALERENRFQALPRIDWEPREGDTDVLRFDLPTGRVLLNRTGQSDAVAVAAAAEQYSGLIDEALQRWAELKTAQMLPADDEDPAE